MASIQETLEFIKINDMRWLDLQFVNMDGGLQHKTFASKNIGEDAFLNGMETELSEIFGFTSKTLSLIPDPDSFARIPWEPNTLRIISSIYSMPEKERFAKDSRYSIERVNINAKAMGISDVQIGTEAEFYVFDNVNIDKLSPERGSSVMIESREGVWNPSPFWNAKKGAYMGAPHDSMYAARIQIAEIMEDHFRYAIDSHIHGRSPNGQQRMKIHDYNAKIAADAFVTFKYVVKNIAFIAGNVATFMPLPIMNDYGNALAITQRLKKGSDNLFYDVEDAYSKLSQTARYYIGGILEHAEALSIFTAPTTNSYKKFKIDPRYIMWSKNHANALVNAPQMADDESKEIIYSGADSSINPYIAYSTIVAAGLDGIKNKTEPGDPVEDITLDSKKMKESKIRPLPNSIVESMSALESDNKFFKGFISPELLADYLEQKIAEHKENEKRPTVFEIDKYFNK